MSADMNILMTGGGKGSFEIRGTQLGAAIGATVCKEPTEVAGFDLAIIVKRVRPEVLARLRAARVLVVYDVVDSWPQPPGNDWNRDECLAWLRQHISAVRPAAIVAATQKMAEDCAEFGVPVLPLPHHARSGARNPIRKHVKAVGYEGGERYIERWRRVVEAECRRRGWEFHVNPPGGLASVDIVVALRDQHGYAPRCLKSNVKLANAQGSGTPFIGNREVGYMETDNGAAVWADTEEEVAAAFDMLTPYSERTRRAQILHDATITLDSVAGTYREWLAKL
jgi:hypothetical protein